MIKHLNNKEGIKNEKENSLLYSQFETIASNSKPSTCSNQKQNLEKITKINKNITNWRHIPIKQQNNNNYNNTSLPSHITVTTTQGGGFPLFNKNIGGNSVTG